jgi:chromate reductase, NAD(P)H dehydrogenase (quinone)
MEILAISGSLRANSSNTTLLRAAAGLAPEGVQIHLYDSIGNLPHFNADLEKDMPPVVKDFRSLIQSAQGLMISSPEYAHGVPGSLKNALDWLVSGNEFPGKPVALLNTSSRGTYAQASLTETITVMTGRIIAEASVTIPILGKNIDAEGILSRPELAKPLRAAIAAFVTAIKMNMHSS